MKGESTERALTLRKFGEYISVETALSPLFRYMRWYASRTPDEIYLLSIDPVEIDQLKFFPPAAVPVTGPDALCGAVGGPWDWLTVSVENHYIYQSVRVRLDSGAPWSETQLYRHPRYEHDPEKANKRGEKIDRLIESIDENGYQQRFDPDGNIPERDEDAPTNEWVGDVHVGDEMIVGVDRNGEFVHLKNGRHRLAVARYLGIKEIPVVVSLVHPRARAKLPGEAQPIHPD